MSQPLSLPAAGARVATTGGIVNTAVAQYTGITWPVLLIYVCVGAILLFFSLYLLLRGERALRLERKLFHGHTVSSEVIVENGVDWLTRFVRRFTKK